MSTLAASVTHMHTFSGSRQRSPVINECCVPFEHLVSTRYTRLGMLFVKRRAQLFPMTKSALGSLSSYLLRSVLQ